MKLALLCPFARPGQRDWVRANVARQLYREATLAVVENGEALGAWGAPLPGEIVLQCDDPHWSSAKNEAIRWAREHGYSHVATWDDDDYYGSRWLLQAVTAFARGASVVGQSSYLVQWGDGTIERVGHDTRKPGSYVIGPTLTWELYLGSPEFPRVQAEEMYVQEALARDGRRTTPFDCGSFVYRRHPGGHAFAVADATLRSQLPCYSVDARSLVGLDVDVRELALPRDSGIGSHHP